MKIIRRRSKRPLYVFLVLVLVAGYGYWALHRPLPLLKPEVANRQIQVKTIPGTLAWPTSGQAAVSLPASDILENHGNQTPAPTASVAKVITALVVLQKKPLTLNQQGPTITLTPNDVALYKNYAAEDGSLVPVAAGEKISEYQMLQAMMLPSANNMADSLAIWAYGSLANYAAAANAYLATHGLTNTHVGKDASGLDPSTVSTASDLVKIGGLAMQSQVLKQIVDQQTTPGVAPASTLKNVNLLLGTNGIIGIKTGNSDPAGGVFLSASQVTINNKPTTVITAVMGSPTLFQALKASLNLIKSAQANFAPVTLARANDIVNSYKVPWSDNVNAIASSDLKTTVWKGSTIKATVMLHPLSIHDMDAGRISLPDNSSVGVRLQKPIPPPSKWWRLTHPMH